MKPPIRAAIVFCEARKTNCTPCVQLQFFSKNSRIHNRVCVLPEPGYRLVMAQQQGTSTAVSISKYMATCIGASINTYLLAFTHAYTHSYMRTSTIGCRCACIYVCMYVCTSGRRYVFLDAPPYVSIYLVTSSAPF